MNRFSTLILIGVAGLLASCGSSSTSSTQPDFNQTYSMVVSPTQLSLGEGDWTTITATEEISVDNNTSKPLSPQPAKRYFSSSTLVTVSPAGEICAGQWDAKFITCSPTTNRPTGFVTITASDPARGVSASATVTVHARPARIALSAPNWGARTCISQSNPTNVPVTATNANNVQYVATAFDASGNPIASCTPNDQPGCIRDNDYTWTTGDTNVAEVSSYGNVVSRNPGVTTVKASVDGASGTLDFITCPPTAIAFTTSPYTGGIPTPPFSPADLVRTATADNALSKGTQVYVNATLVDANGNTLVTSPLTFVNSNPLNGLLTPDITLTDILTAETPGHFTMVAACEPPTCNPAVNDFISPAGPGSGQSLGFGYPVYSNPIGVTVEGSASSVVLVAGTQFVNLSTANQLLVFNSASMSLAQQPASLPNTPNSLVVSADGTKAYLGSSAGLMTLDLTQTPIRASVQNFPVTGQLSTFLITGTVLGVSQHGRYVVIFDPLTDPADPNLAHFPNNSLVFLIDTTGTKAATLYRLPKNANITAVAFSSDADIDGINLGDGNRLWLGGNATTADGGGVYAFQNDTFVLNPNNASSFVNSLAWMPDGQSYFASGHDPANVVPDNMVTYSTCNNQQVHSTAGPISTVSQGLATTAVSGVPHVIGLDQSQGVANSKWFDYQTSTNGAGDVCLSGVTVSSTSVSDSTLPCTATQVSFSPILEEAFITGVASTCGGDTAIRGYSTGYSAGTQQPISLTTLNSVIPLSGGVLNDGSALFFGSFDGTTGLLHRVDINPSTGQGSESIAPVVTAGPGNQILIPAFVAVVPR